MAEDNKDSKSSNQMWGGRFASGPAAIMEEINASIGFDKKLYAQDIRGSKAHATMLAHQGIISAEDKDKILHGLAFYGLTLMAVVAFPSANLLKIAIPMSVFGAVIELVQGLSFIGRDKDVWDWVADTAAIAAVLIPLVFSRWRTPA